MVQGVVQRPAASASPGNSLERCIACRPRPAGPSRWHSVPRRRHPPTGLWGGGAGGSVGGREGVLTQGSELRQLLAAQLPTPISGHPLPAATLPFRGPVVNESCQELVDLWPFSRSPEMRDRLLLPVTRGQMQDYGPWHPDSQPSAAGWGSGESRKEGSDLVLGQKRL